MSTPQETLADLARARRLAVNALLAYRAAGATEQDLIDLPAEVETTLREQSMGPLAAAAVARVATARIATADQPQRRAA